MAKMRYVCGRKSLRILITRENREHFLRANITCSTVDRTRHPQCFVLQNCLIVLEDCPQYDVTFLMTTLAIYVTASVVQSGHLVNMALLLL
jgi:hypothetical protein